jgi:hypothetical protein
MSFNFYPKGGQSHLIAWEGSGHALRIELLYLLFLCVSLVPGRPDFAIHVVVVAVVVSVVVVVVVVSVGLLLILFKSTAAAATASLDFQVRANVVSVCLLHSP